MSCFKCCVSNQEPQEPQQRSAPAPKEEEPEVPEPQETLSPTLKPASNFNARQDCEKLREAMHGVGTDEIGLNTVLCKRSVTQRAEIEKAYKEVFQKDLEAKIVDETSGSYKRLLLHLLKTQPSELAAVELHEAMQGEGMDVNGLIEIICTARRNNELNELKQKYQQLFNQSLDAAVAVEAKDSLKEFLAKLLSGTRPEKGKFRAQVNPDAKALNDAAAKKDPKPFIEILGSRRFAQLHAILDEFKRAYKNDLAAVVKQTQFPQKEFHDAVLTFVTSLKTRPVYFAERLHEVLAIQEEKKRDNSLIRILALRVEVDLEAIKTEYQRLHGHPLANDLKEKLAGDFEKAVLTLIGA